MRKIYWYITAYIKKHGLTFFISVFFAIAFFSVFIPILAKKITIKKKRYIGVVGEYNLKNLPTEVKNSLSVGLTKVNPEDKNVKPLLAERWITEDSGKTYRFIIKKDVFWTDGKELVTDDVNYNFKDVETITTPNDVIFKLPDKFAPFPQIVSEPLLRYESEAHLFFFKRPTVVGIGPYRLTSYQNQSGRLKQVVLDGPKQRLVYRFYLTEQNALMAFKKGEVDLLKNITNPQNLINWKEINIKKSINFDQYLAVFFNNQDPLLKKNIRQALNYSVKKEAGTARALGPINPNSWAYLEGGKDYNKDMDRAVERLLEGLPPEPLKLTLTTTSLFTNEAERIKAEWEQLGQAAYTACQKDGDVENKGLCNNAQITIDVKISNFPDTNNFQLLLIGQQIPDDPDQYFMWHSDQATNFTNYKNTRIDSLLEKGRQTLEQQERKAAYQEFQQFLLEDPPAIFLTYLLSYTISR
ncbi:MAG: ABC transporter substrate-binding protein [Patescibacteria group bacterium]|nr:ABC transporter substrate-binding protein [Patescibacteria group bacterium]